MRKYTVLTSMCSCPVFLSLSVPLLNAQLSEVKSHLGTQRAPHSTDDQETKTKVMKSKKIISDMLISILYSGFFQNMFWRCICVCVCVCINVWISFHQNIIQPRRNKILKYQPPWGLPEGNKLVAKPSQLLSSQLLTSTLHFSPISH